MMKTDKEENNIMTYPFGSISKMKDAIKERLYQKALEASAKIKQDLVSEESEDDMEFYVSFRPEDTGKIKGIAELLGVEYESDVDGQIEVTETDGAKLDAFFSTLEKQGIEWLVEPDELDDGAVEVDEDTLDEKAKLKRIKPADKLAAKRDYRRNKAKLKIKNKKYRKSASGKKTLRKAKKMAKRGKTSTGKRITRKT